MAEIASVLVAAVGALGALAGWYLTRRSAQLRLAEVTAWAERSIAALQSVYLVCALTREHEDDATLGKRMDELIFDTSILIEQGRLFFRNKFFENYGIEKPEAYRGLRPRVLDSLVIAHQVTCGWGAADHRCRQRMALTAYDAVREFVSLIRHEVGRDVVASTGAADGGQGVWLAALLNAKSDRDIQNHHWPLELGLPKPISGGS